VYAFAARTSPTVAMSSNDRLLSGGKINAFFDNLSVAANYVGMNDVDPQSETFSYRNYVSSGEIKYALNKNYYALKINLEAGNSTAINSHLSAGNADTTYKNSDYFGDFYTAFTAKRIGITFSAEAKYVGPYFSSPTAQSRRITDTQTPALFASVRDASVARTAILFDRLTSEQIYNAKISPLLSSFYHEYNNALPYGKATPNRAGTSFEMASDTSLKNIHFEIGADYLSEIFGEGTTQRRTFTIAKGAILLELGKIIHYKKKINLNINARMENTSRTKDDKGGAIKLNSTLIDAGISFEIVKKIDLLAGIKMLSAAGNEFNATRNAYNYITVISPVNISSNEMILSGGIQVRASEQQSFTAQYNYVNYQNKTGTNNSYFISQIFVSYTGKF
jgi:hypothetical protein